MRPALAAALLASMAVLAACGQPLAIEIVCGKDRLITNAGWSPDAAAPQAFRPPNLALTTVGKELYDRLAKAGEDLRKVGTGLTTAVNNYNSFVSSFESRALVSARKFRDLNIEPGSREIAGLEPVEALARYGDEQPLRLPDAAE